MASLIRYGLLFLAFGGGFAALAASQPYGGMLFAVLCLWEANMVYALEKLRERILFFWFHVTLFTFLIGRPVIGALRGELWWDYGHENVMFALMSLILTLVFLHLGALLGNQWSLRRREAAGWGLWEQKGFCYYFGWVSQIIFYLSLVFTFMLGMEKVVYIQTHTYYEYFSDFKSQLPYVVYELSTLTKYSLCFFLACMPKKSLAFPVLALYVLSAVPELIVGERNPIVLNAIFALSYYVIRDFFRVEKEKAGRAKADDVGCVESSNTGHVAAGNAGFVNADSFRADDFADGQPEKPWLGTLEKGALLLAVPLGLILLGAMNYLREGQGMEGGMNPAAIIADLFYKQGVSFKWLALGFGAMPFLPHNGFTNYTFGSFIDYFCNGSIAQKFFGAVSLGSSNSLLKAQMGNNFSHHLSYILLGDEYLAGHGCGSSYLLEVFADYGYLGIVVFSLILGLFLVCAPRLAGKNAVLFSIILLCMTNLFLIPRAEATGFLQFVLTMQFWAAFVICCGGALILSHKFYPRKGRIR